MRSDHLIGTSIPRFTYDTPSAPKNDFYALCEGAFPLVMIFLPAFDHPITREYITRYAKTLPDLEGVRLCCVVRSNAQAVSNMLKGKELPFTLICDGAGVLYNFMGIEEARVLRNWSFEAQRIFKAARAEGYQYDRNAPQMLPLTLAVGHEGKIRFAHYSRNLTDLPADCATIREICEGIDAVSRAKATDPRCSDETLTLPDLVEDLEQEDAISSLFD